jgi:predicted metal-dependent hydrolase
MSINSETLHIANIEIEVIRKDIKNMHLAVYPPDGRIRLAVPNTIDDEVFRLFAISKLAWIKKHVKNFQSQNRETPREYISGESHYYLGKRYLLEVIEHQGKNTVDISASNKLLLKVRPGTTKASKEKLLKEWYRTQMKEQVPPLLQKWERIIGVQANDWGIKQMKTKWGACNIEAKRIWLNLELAKKPPICLEYILVHELVHLHERHHNERFIGLMNQFMPKWRLHREELNRLPISHNDWGY